MGGGSNLDEIKERKQLQAIILFENEQKQIKAREDAIKTLRKSIETYLLSLKYDIDFKWSIIGALIDSITLTAYCEASNKKVILVAQVLINQLFRRYQLPDYTMALIVVYIETLFDAIGGDTREQLNIKKAIYHTVMENTTIYGSHTFTESRAPKLDPVQIENSVKHMLKQMAGYTDEELKNLKIPALKKGKVKA